jgi:hypothetical protein
MPLKRRSRKASRKGKRVSRRRSRTGSKQRGGDGAFPSGYKYPVTTFVGEDQTAVPTVVPKELYDTIKELDEDQV